jgi:tetratricopeptide (TPR) repeat protein
MRQPFRAAMLLLLTPLLTAAAQTPVQSAQQDFQAGHFAQAAATLDQAASSIPNDATLYYWLGRSYYEMKDYQKASQNMEQAVKLNGQDSDYHYWLGKIYGQMADSHRSLWLGIKTRKEFETAIQLNPKNVLARRALVEFYTGAPWIVGGSKNKARDEIAAIGAIDPVQGQLAQADYDHMVGDVTGAEREYEKVLAADAPDPVEYYEAADYFAARGNAPELKRAIDDVQRIAPNDPRLGYYQGVLLTLEGSHLEEAETYLKAYLAATVDRTDYPSHANARTWLGHVYEQMGRRLAAAEQYRAALQIDPDSGFAKKSLQSLEKQMN